MKWGDESIQGSRGREEAGHVHLKVYPPPNTLATIHHCGQVRTTRQWSCVRSLTLGRYSEPQIDCLILHAEVQRQSLASELAEWLHTRLLSTTSADPFHNKADNLIAVYHPPPKQALHAMCPSSPVIIPITHPETHHAQFYCSPSGFSELLPARKISSVDNRLMAITELRKSGQGRGRGFASCDSCQLAEMKERTQDAPRVQHLSFDAVVVPHALDHWVEWLA